MATDKDALKKVVDLLTTNWNPTNTDSQTPVIKKIYERGKEMDLRANDFVFVYTTAHISEAVGIGNDTYANTDDSIRIDIRVHDAGADDTHARKVLTEVNRILHENRLNVAPEFCELKPFGNMNDLSDRTRKIFRYVKDINLIDWSRDMTA